MPTPVFNASTGHYYEGVAAPNISWSAALTAAAASSYRGLKGYLATVTSANENATAFSVITPGQLSSGYANGSFEDSPVGASTVKGWTVVNTRIKLDGIDRIGGWATPIDTTRPGESGGDTVSMPAGYFSTKVVANSDQGASSTRGATSLQLESTGISVAPYGIVHGPYVVSNTAISLKSGDKVSFDWKAEGGADAYDVYAYLLNIDNGTTVRLLDTSGSMTTMKTNWATVTSSVPTNGNYKFVFIAGTFDATGGTVAGARLFIDNVMAPPTANPVPGTGLSGYYLGASDEKIEGQWIWKTGPELGQAISYSNWYPGEPNNGGGGANPKQSFLQLLSIGNIAGYDQKWADTWGQVEGIVTSTANGYVIEYGGLAPSYRITADTYSVLEGQKVTFSVNTTNIEWGKTIPYTITGISADDLVAGSLTGNLTVGQSGEDGIAEISFDIKKDGLVEGVENLTFTVGDQSVRVLISDGLPTTPTYSIVSNATGVNEGQSITFNIYTSNVAFGNTLPYRITGIGNEDLSSGTTSGTLTVVPLGAGGVAQISFTLKADSLTEGTEILTLQIGDQYVKVPVYDTSRTLPTYQIYSNSKSVSEGQKITFSVYTTDVDLGSMLPYTISGITNDDLVSGSITGTLPILKSGSNGLAEITFEIKNDFVTEGIENLTFTVGDKSLTIPIYDTSRAQAFEISASSTTVNEGEAAVFLVKTTNVPDGTLLSYTISGVQNADVVGGLTGSTVVVSGGQAVIAIPTVVDMVPENTTLVVGKDAAGKDITKTLYGTEIMTVSVSGVFASVQLKDWSTKPTYTLTPVTSSVSEGNDAKFLLKTTGLMPGAGVRYEISGSVNQSDYVNPWGGTWGVAKITGLLNNGQAIISIPIIADRLTEDYVDPATSQLIREKLTVTVGEKSASINIIDSSLTPSFSIKPNNIDKKYKEGESIIFNITTVNVDPLSSIDYQITGSIDAADIGIPLQGHIQLDRLARGTLVIPLIRDTIDDSDERLTVELIGTGISTTVSVFDHLP